MKRKGFTLIELLAVIVVLAIIAIIAIPVITGVIDNSKKGAFKSSVLGMMEAADLYRATNTIEYGNDEKVVFECNGSECSSNKGKLSFKGEVPTSGQIIMYKDGRVEAYYLQNREYCARGERTELNIQKDCFSMDDTNPELEVNFIKGTTNEIIINVKAVDLESGIKKITYEIDGKLIEENYIGETNLDVNKIFDNLGNDKTYSIKVTVENRNEKITESTVEGTTLLINSPGVGVEAEEVEASGYYINQVVNITYDNTNIESPEYFVRTTRSGVSSINIDAVCGEENEPTECEEIEETTILEADKWYKVSGDLKVSYSELSTNTGTIYATIYDGTNYITTTGVILKTTVKTAYKVNHHQMNLDGTTYTLAETEELTEYAYIDATPNTKTYEGFTNPDKKTVNVLADRSSVIDYYYTRNQYTVTVNKGTGIASVSGAGSYYYGASVTVGYTETTGYHFSSWTGDKTTSTFTMPSSNVTMQANGAANTYTVTFNANGGVSGSTTSVTTTYNTSAYYTYGSIVPTRSGYKFKGYYTAASGGVQVYDSNGTCVNGTGYWSNNLWIYAGNVTLYAQWEVSTVTLSGLTGSSSEENGLCYYIINYGTSGKTFSYNGYSNCRFTSYSCGMDCDDVGYSWYGWGQFVWNESGWWDIYSPASCSGTIVCNAS